MADKTVQQIKADIFDVLRSQQTLQLEVQELEKTKNSLLKELSDAEAAVSEAQAKVAPTGPRLAE